MSAYVHRSQVASAQNGTTDHTLTFSATPAAGSLLVLLVHAAATVGQSPAGGWAPFQHALDSVDVTAFQIAEAVGDETSVTVTLSVGNYPAQLVMYEYLPGSTVGASARQDSGSNPGPTLSNLDVPGTVPVYTAIGYAVNGSDAPADPGPYLSPDTGGAVDYMNIIPKNGSIAGAGLVVWEWSAWDGATTPTHSPSAFLTNTTGLSTVAASGRVSFWVAPPPPTPLDTPVRTRLTKTNPTAPDGNDGTATFSWPPVANADHYEAGIAVGHGVAQGDIAVVNANVTSPYTFTGLTAGLKTFAIRAVPAS